MNPNLFGKHTRSINICNTIQTNAFEIAFYQSSTWKASFVVQDLTDGRVVRYISNWLEGRNYDQDE